EPWEIMISESQERMVAVVSPEHLAAVEEVCERWELAYARIGEVTETAELRAYFDGDLVGAIPAAYLTDGAPRYDVPRQPRTPAGRWPSSRRRAPSPARAASRSRSRTASTSGTPRNRRSPGSWPRRSRACRPRATRSESPSSPATSRCTTTPTAARSTPRRS